MLTVVFHFVTWSFVNLTFFFFFLSFTMVGPVSLDGGNLCGVGDDGLAVYKFNLWLRSIEIRERSCLNGGKSRGRESGGINPYTNMGRVILMGLGK